jgi:ATP-dependent exoDNAse (exonuclease V) beta subunit
MTMHKSKGLEFDSVFLVSLEKGKPAEKQSLINWSERIDPSGESKFILSPVAEESESNPLSDFLRFHESKKSDIEDTRVFYVACTRAKQRLYLSGNLETDKKGDRKPASRSLLAKIWDTEKDEFIHIDTPLTELKKDTKPEQAPVLTALPEQWQDSISQHFSESGSSTVFDNSDYNFFEDWKDTTDNLRDQGTLFHEIMRQGCEYGFEEYLRQPKATLISEWQGLTHKLKINTYFQHDDYTVFFEKLSSLSETDHGKWITSQYAFSKNEWELWTRAKNTSQKKIIDRSFIDGDTFWVIDYKTAVPELNQNMEHFLQLERKQYETQLRDYCQIVHDYLSSRNFPSVKKIRCGLLFVFLSHFEALNELERKL